MAEQSPQARLALWRASAGLPGNEKPCTADRASNGLILFRWHLSKLTRQIGEVYLGDLFRRFRWTRSICGLFDHRNNGRVHGFVPIRGCS